MTGAVVVGASGGLGRALVRAIAERGAHDPVFALSRSGSEDAGPIVSARIDLTDEAAIAEFVGSLKGRPVAGLVNSAGVGSNTEIRETTTEMFRRIYEINVVAGFALVQSLLPQLEAGRGSVVNIASVSGILGNLGRSAYGASKGAIVTLTKIMAVELAASGIRVNAVAPGPIETAMARQMHDAAARQRWVSRVPLARYGEPDEIAGAVLFLIDPTASSYVTGQILAVDGGFTTAGLMP